MFLNIKELVGLCNSSRIYLAPYNDLSVKLKDDINFFSTANFSGYVDSRINKEGVFKPLDMSCDAIIIVSSPAYWKEISSNLEIKNIYLNTPKGFILFSSYKSLVDSGRYFDCVVAIETSEAYQLAVKIISKISKGFYSLAVVSSEQEFTTRCSKVTHANLEELESCYVSLSINYIESINSDINLAVILSGISINNLKSSKKILNKKSTEANVLFHDGFRFRRETLLPNEYISPGESFIDVDTLFDVINADLDIFRNGNSNLYSHYTDSLCYSIIDNYMSPRKYHHYSDLDETDSWQLEVYLFALGLMKKNNYSSVADVGCGSAYKLITYFGDYETIGVELSENVKYLNKKYPSRVWLETDFLPKNEINVDVIIFSDVIEHLVNPTEALNYLQCQNFKYLVISTPAKEYLYKESNPFFFGPPKNKAHQREWTMLEFKCYLNQFFKVVDQRLTNYSQSTQMIICKKL